jgi:phage protein D
MTEPAPPSESGAGVCRIKLGTQDVPNKAIDACRVDLEVGLPDQATIVLNNANSDLKFSSETKLGDPIEVKMGEGAKVIFKGEVVCIEPIFEAGGPSKVTIRGFSLFHRMTRGKFSKTYENQTLKAIVTELCQRYDISPDDIDGTYGGDEYKYEHVYQHNQTDYDFLMQRAARVGAEVIFTPPESEGKAKLLFRPKDLRARDANLKMSWSDPKPTLQKFNARLTTAGMVQKIVVRAWNPDNHEELVGEATAPQVKLGKTDGATAAKEATGDTEVFYYDTDIPCFSQKECEAIAKAKLEEMLLNHVTGDLLVEGNPDLKPSMVVELDLKDDRFDGKYRLKAVSQQYGHKKSGEGGYKVLCKVQRNASEKES